MGVLDYGHVPQLLESTAIRYRNGAFRIQEMLSLVHVEHKSDEIEASDKRDVFTVEANERGEDGRSNFVNFHEHTVEFKCINHAEHTWVSDKVIKNRNVPEALMMRRAEDLTQRILLSREVRGCSFCSTAANFGFTSDVAGQWADFAVSNPVDDIKSALSQMLIPGNVFGIGELDYLTVLSRHPAVLDHVSGGSTSEKPAIVPPDVMAIILGVRKVVVFGAKHRTNPMSTDANAAWSPVMNNSACLLYVDGLDEPEFEPDIDISSFGWLASWDPDQQKRHVRVNTDYDKQRDGGSNFVEVEEDVAVVNAVPEAGHLFQNISTAA